MSYFDRNAVFMINRLCETFLKQAKTKRENGLDFAASAFAFVPDPDKPSTWKLRLIEKPGGVPTPAQVGRAVAALGKGFRGQKVQIPAKDLAGVKRKVAAAFRRANPGRELPAVLKT